MLDLNKERKAFEASHDTSLVLEKIEYIAAINCYIPKYQYANQLIVMQVAERFNFGWIIWQKAKAQAVPVWVSTDFMLPDERDLVLGISKTKLAKFNVYQVVALDEFKECDITHWMPLPAGPSESGAEG